MPTIDIGGIPIPNHRLPATIQNSCPGSCLLSPRARVSRARQASLAAAAWTKVSARPEMFRSAACWAMAMRRCCL
eukprot:scaffold803_cov310-Pinguiococcus_pyrenoidosus.AAC.181